jgi:hypothetical protein
LPKTLSKNVSKFIPRLCVRLAETAGWLYQVRAGVVISYLSAHSADAEQARDERFTSARFVFAGLAIFANVSAFVLIALVHPTQTSDLLAKREQEAIVLYKELVTLQDVGQTRPGGSNDAFHESLTGARNQLDRLLLQLDELHGTPELRPLKTAPEASANLQAIRRALEVGGSNPENPLRSSGFPQKGSVAERYVYAAKQISQLRSALENTRLALDQTSPQVYAYAAQIGRRTVTREQLLSLSPDFPALKEVAETRLPTELSNWNGFLDPNGSPYETAEVLEGKSLRSIAGGIIMALTSTPKKTKDLSSFVLTYDLRKKELALLGPQSVSYYSEPIEPEALKALINFVGKGQTIAASIGWSGEGKTQLSDGTVLLDPAFVDTRPGQDLVRADVVPWEFGQKKVAGWTNPFASQFRTDLDNFFEHRVSELGEYLSNQTVDPNSLSKLLDQLRETQSVKTFITGCSIEPERLQVLLLLARAHKSHLSMTDFAREVYPVFLPETALATLYDEGPSFDVENSKLLLESHLEYRYVAWRIQYGDTIKFGDCLHEDQVARMGALEGVVNTHIEDITEAFPAVRKVGRYGAIAAFLRWARVPGHLQAIDFYSLLGVTPHNVEKTPTPDHISR